MAPLALIAALWLLDVSQLAEAVGALGWEDGGLVVRSEMLQDFHDAVIAVSMLGLAAVALAFSAAVALFGSRIARAALRHRGSHAITTRRVPPDEAG
jgi:hypothetical protein